MSVHLTHSVILICRNCLKEKTCIIPENYNIIIIGTEKECSDGYDFQKELQYKYIGQFKYIKV